ncbi:MAG: RNA 3'-terminal phosphate cyclase [Planctomycetes bacterium]|nr:RNA 3'-terminal phosphate cyclase [Planctomycetota bacterium]
MTGDSIHIDGSFGEGGGQILRTSLALSCITGRPFEITNIRANRSKPGLRPQHLQCVHAAAQITHADVMGAKVGSSRVSLAPGPIRAGDYRFDIGTAGSTSLVLHTIIFPLALADGPSSVTITGGTHVPFAPCFHYLEQQWAPALGTLGFHLSLCMKSAGYYPAGGGRISAGITPAEGLSPLTLTDRGGLVKVRILSVVSNLPGPIAQRQAVQAEKKLVKQKRPVEVEIADLPSPGKGTMLFLQARFERSEACFFGLGAIGKRAERVADEACAQLLSFLRTEGAVDRFLADQLLVPLSLASGESRFTTERITQHLLTNAEVIRMFLPSEVHIEGELNQPGTVTVRGRGWRAE